MLLNKKSVSFRIGLAIAVILAALALLSYVWTPYDPAAITGSERSPPVSSTREFFGADALIFAA